MTDVGRRAAAGGSAATRLESMIAQLWQESLGVERVLPDDDFFRLGGESLQAITMLAAVEEICGAQISFTDFVEAPTVAGLSAAIAGARQLPSADLPPAVPPRVGENARIPCTSAQRRLWFIDQMTAGVAAYNMPATVRLRGPLDADRLQLALHELVRRHDALRTSFVSEEGIPAQSIAPEARLDLVRVDLRNRPDAEGEARRLVDDFAARPFDLTKAPLACAQLIELEDDENVLQLVFHHIICDGISIAIAFRELAGLYESADTLPEPSIQYADHAVRESRRLESGGANGDLDYWRRRLAGIPLALTLPMDGPRPPAPSYRGATLRVPVPDHVERSLRSFSRQEGISVIAALLAAYQLVLSRYSGQETVVVGATTSGRAGRCAGEGIGLFANTVALRGDISAELGFRDVAADAWASLRDAIAHDAAPFEQLAAEVQPAPDLSRHPVFQAFFAQVPDTPLPLSGVVSEPFDPEPGTSRFDLTLFVFDRPAGLELAWEYSTDLFSSSLIGNLSRHFLHLLEAGLAEATVPAAGLPLISESERRELLEATAPASTAYDVSCLHELFEAGVERHPEALAAVSEVGALTYRELNERANRLAHHLRGCGVGHESMVALLLGRSLDIVVAVLAVLKAGGAYVPLDPDYPPERLAFMLEDTSARAVVTQSALLDHVPPGALNVVCLDRDAAELAQLPSGNPGPVASPESLAYVIYTSGSTGQPKGVMVEHRNVSRLLAAAEEHFSFGPEDTWLLFHSYAFDFSVWEIWGALLSGGRLVIAPHWTTRSPEALRDLLVQQGVTVFNVTPSVFLADLEELVAARDDLSLRYVIFGGEALQPAALRPWFAAANRSGPQLVNMYGITETTVHVTYRLLAPEDAEREDSPIGRPLADLQAYLLDANAEPVPPGVPGELFVGGAGVARGYLNRPELTGERFLPSPFGEGRLYRTGDLARRRSEGELVYLGRIDNQVKIRGFRIELGEIAAALSDHEAVVDALALAFEPTPGDRQLAAYVVARSSDQLEGELWELLERKLPPFMVPSSLIVLDSFPLTPNGKVDRRALPAPLAASRSQQHAFVPPRNPLEETIAAIWSELLHIDSVGAHDNFFHLGGHSLLAAQVVTRLRKQLGANLSVRTLFEQPTLSAFAEQVAAGLAEPRQMPADTAAVDAAEAGNYPLSSTQQQLLFLDELAPDEPTYNAALAVRVEGTLDLDAFGAAVDTTIRRHEALRTIVRHGPQGPEQVVLDTWPSELPVVDLEVSPTAEADELSRLLHDHVRRPFDLSQDLMLRTTVFRLGPETHILLLQTHHIAVDGWSVDLLFGEISEHYDAHRSRRPARLQELTLQYRDFALWQREHLRGDVLDGHLDYWRSALAGAPTMFDVAGRDKRRSPAAVTGRVETVLPEELATSVARVCREAAVTPYMLLLAAFGTLLYRLTGQDDMLLGSPFANRPRAEFEPVIGFFANTVVLRVRTGGNPSFSELLSRVRETVVGAQEHQELPLTYVVEALAPPRVRGVNPLFQVNFRVRLGHPPQLELAGTTTTRLDLDVGLPRFDLALELEVTPESVAAQFLYNDSLLDRAVVEHLSSDFSHLLEHFLADPELPLLSFHLERDSTAPLSAPIPSRIAGRIGRAAR